MTDAQDYRARTFRFAGCFSPEEIRVMDRVLDESVTEAAVRTRGIVEPPDLAELRSSFATVIISCATRGDLDPVRLKASALSLLEGLPLVSDESSFRVDRAAG